MLHFFFAKREMSRTSCHLRFDIMVTKFGDIQVNEELKYFWSSLKKYFDLKMNIELSNTKEHLS